MLGLQHHPEGKAKDTTRNIRERGEFVVNLVDESLAEAMNICAVDFPPDMSEIDAAGLGLAASLEHRAAAYRERAVRARVPPHDHPVVRAGP